MTGPCPASPIAQLLNPAESPTPVPSGWLSPQEGRYRAGSKTLKGEGIAGGEPVVLERGGPLPTQANPLSRPPSAIICYRLARAGRALPRPSPRVDPNAQSPLSLPYPSSWPPRPTLGSRTCELVPAWLPTAPPVLRVLPGMGTVPKHACRA